MRNFLTICAMLAASTALADDIPLLSKVAVVTIYPQMAELTRKAQAEVPAGRHRLILQDVPDSARLETLQISLSGARLLGTRYRTDEVPPREGGSAEVAAAQDRIKEIELRIRAVRDAAARVRQDEQAAQTAIGFLQQLGSNEGLAEVDADALRDIARMIREETAQAGAHALEAGIEARGVEDALADLEDDLAKARQALAAIALEDEDRLYLAVDILAEAAGPVALELSYISEGSSGWMPGYELHLSTAEKPGLSLRRSVYLHQDTGENWHDVELTLSSLAPSGRGGPSAIFPQGLRIEDPGVVGKQRSSDDGVLRSLAEPVFESAVVVEQAQPTWGADTEGAGVTYRFAHPVSVASSADVVRLEMDRLTTEAEVMALAVPLQDDTAYRLARITNTFGEDLLAAEQALHFVDGKLTAIEPFAALAAGAETEIGFGPIRGLQVRRDVLRQTEGERGMISRSNQQVQRVEIEVENLTADSWPLRVLDRVPYSMHEDLEISWSASPKVTEENPQKQRGILAWDFDLAPGERRTINLDTTLSWPEGMVLR